MVHIFRGGKIESKHHIHAAVFNSHEKMTAYTGEPHFPTFFRSSAKPFQTLALFRTGVIDHFGFSDRQIALFTASHNGEDFHIRAVREVMERIGLTEDHLKCGFHPPYLQAAAEDFFARKLPRSPVYNNCSGKHAGMLAACIANGFDVSCYLQPEHPHQRQIREVIGEFSKIRPGKLEIAIDGCGVPAFYLTLSIMANMNLRFAQSSDPAIARIRQAVTEYPEYLAGTDRFDTEFNRLLNGRAITKVGAEAIQSFVFFEPEPVGVIVKCEDGNFRASESASVEILQQLNLITKDEAESLRKFWQPELKNHAGTVVGRIKPDIELMRESGFWNHPVR